MVDNGRYRCQCTTTWFTLIWWCAINIGRGVRVDLPRGYARNTTGWYVFTIEGNYGSAWIMVLLTFIGSWLLAKYWLNHVKSTKLTTRLIQNRENQILHPSCSHPSKDQSLDFVGMFAFAFFGRLVVTVVTQLASCTLHAWCGSGPWLWSRLAPSRRWFQCCRCTIVILLRQPAFSIVKPQVSFGARELSCVFGNGKGNVIEMFFTRKTCLTIKF